MKNKVKRILLVGGGTAGHVDPALAMAEWFRSSPDAIEVALLGTKHGLEMSLAPKANLPLYTIARVKAPRKISFAAPIFPFRFLFATIEALKIVRKFDLVIGFGGYVSAPAYLAAKLIGKPILIHEGNAIPGWANKLGMRWCAGLTSAFAIKDPKWKRAVRVGMPLTTSFTSLGILAQEEFTELRTRVLHNFELDENKKVILVFGGSQGSTKINQTIFTILPNLLAKEIQVIHGVGKGNLPSAKNIGEGSAGYYPTEYIHNMAEVMASVDLIICRSGAVTVSQIEEIGAPAVLIPLGIGNGEQSANAEALVNKGEGEIILDHELSGENLAGAITSGLIGKLKKYPVGTSIHHSASEQLGKIALDLINRVHPA